MGLLNSKNIAKAKDLAMKNRDKVAPAVSKATGAIDKKTGGKHSDKLKKLDDAAAKISGKDPEREDATESAPRTGTADTSAAPNPSSQRAGDAG